jgi:hypothetical protein
MSWIDSRGATLSEATMRRLLEVLAMCALLSLPESCRQFLICRKSCIAPIAC